MSIVDRVKNILLTPGTEWKVIAEEPSSTGGLVTGYVAPLVAIGAVAGFIGGSVVGRSSFFTGTFRVPIATGLTLAIFSFVAAIVGVFILSVVINALAPTFGAEKNSARALKLAVYSYTPAWVAGVLQILPALGLLAILAAFYGIYLMYLGLPTLMKAPSDRTLGYTVVSVVCALVISVAVSLTGMLVVGTGAMAGGALGGGLLGDAAGSSAAADVRYDPDSPLGRLQQLGKQMEASGQKIDAAEKSGDTEAQMTAAMEGLGALLGGGRRVEPVSTDQLKTFVPETLAGLPRTHAANERTGFAGLMVARSEATYSDGNGRSIDLEISDSGGASGLVGLARWAQMQTSLEDDNGSERTFKENGRMVHETTSRSGQDELSLIVGERFVVTARGAQVGIDVLRDAVSSMALDRLEGLKDVGVQKD
jgi:hypothetical protein